MKTYELTNYGKKSLRHALMAIVCGVLAVVSLLDLFEDYYVLAFSISALIFSIIALIAGINSFRVGETEFRGSAIAGLVISSILILILIILLIVLIAIFI